MSARILPVDESNATEELKDVYEKIKSGFGGVPNVFKTIGHKPKALSAFFALTGVLFSDNSITPKIRELAVLMTSMVNQCHYCIFHHTAMGKKAGLTEEQISAIPAYKDSRLFTDEEKSVLAYAECMTLDAEHIPDGVFAALKRSFYSDDKIVLLTMIIGLFQIFNKLNGALKVELEKA